ncbi:MAG: tetratricopeptide repeat protein, partial [Cyanobacteria bacterium P01_A01_bin.68]
VDLGVLKFKSQNNYQIAEFGNYQLNKIQEVFVTGFPKLVNSSSFYFSPGLIFNKEEGLLQTQQSDFQNSNDGKLQTASSFTGGYELVYTNITYGGMGGSPVLDSQGRVIGIHGLAEGETAIDEQTGDCGVNFGCQVQVGYSLGIPIPTLLSSIHRLGLNPNLLKVKNSSPPKLNETQLISFAQVFPQNFSTGNAKASQWLERGNILWLINQFEKAIAAFNEVIKQKPSFIHIAYYQKARVLSFQKKYQEALAASIQAVKLKPNFVAAWKHLSAVYRKLNKPNKALLAIDKAIKLQPKNPSLYNNKWAILKDLRLYLEAELNINKAIQIAPRAVFYNNRGTLYEEQKKWELAEADYSKSIQINPSYPNAYYNRGNLYSTKKKWKLAEADFNKALRLNYYNKEIYKRRGIVRYKLGDRKGAIEDYTELIKHNPEDAETYKNRAIARSEIGDKQGAILDIETAARLYRLQNNLPSYQQVLNVLRILKDSSDKNISISSEQTSDSHKNVHSIAQNITVRISDFGSDGNNFQSSGSGVIINKQGNTYYVLTCAHVIPYEEVRKYHITTPDNKHYLIEANKVYKHPELDIAVIQFTSKESYKVATLANHPIEKFRWIYVAGWSNPSNIESASWLVNPGLVFSKEIGSLDTMNSLSFTKGYELIYTNMTYKGMSGGAILDSKGHLIGIHGKSEGKILYTQNAEKIELHLGYSLGISIDTVLSLDTELQLNSKFLKIESTTPIVDNKFPLVPIENMSVKNNSSISKEKMSEVLLRPGNQLWRLGKFDEANAAFDEIVKLEPTASILVKSYYAKSLALKYQKKYSEALNALNKAIKNKDDFYEAWREKGEILYILGRYSEALSSIEKSIEVNNKNFQEYKDFSLYSWRGQLLHKLKQYSKAIEAYSQAIQIKPHPFNYLNRGIALFHLGRQKEAIKNYTEAIKSKPNYAEAYFNRGIILSNTGDKEKAIQDFTAAIKPEGATIPTKT